jgi:hypothetical protein
MLRCALISAALLLGSLPSAAQLPRNFPANALRGEISISARGAVQVNGQNATLAPGARIRDQRNLLALTGALVNQRLVVNYTTDISGQLKDVWVLRPEERAKKPWPRTAAQAAAWHFDPLAQTWTEP